MGRCRSIKRRVTARGADERAHEESATAAMNPDVLPARDVPVRMTRCPWRWSFTVSQASSRRAAGSAYVFAALSRHALDPEQQRSIRGARRAAGSLNCAGVAVKHQDVVPKETPAEVL
jgi:hypothetical protein